MRNLKVSAKGKTLTIEVDLSKPLGPSKSGKNTVLASTGGNVKIATPDGDVMLGLNVYKKD